MSKTEELILQSQAGDRTAQEQLILENSGLIWSVAKRFIGRGVEMDDLYQLGCLGFIKAISGFDTGYGTQFSTYAVPKISGEIRRFIRDDGSVKVSRGIKERAAVIKTVRNQLLQELGCEPSVQEIAQKTGFTIEEIAVAEMATASVESMHQQTGEDGPSLENILSDKQTEESLVEKISLRQAVDKLAEREKTVIHLRYFHGLTQQRVSTVLGVSQVQVSRIEKKALEHLRRLMI